MYTLGEIICEELPVGMCSLSVASSGKRCLLETSATAGGTMEYQCKTSEVMANNMAELIESDGCISACGLDRNSVGISSDSLLDPQFTSKLCSPACYRNCLNIVDLYYNLASGEGVFLPDLCEAQRTNPRHAMSQLQSSGAASGPASAAANGPASSFAEGSMSSELFGSVACAPASM
ncbi:unnamed protein product [Ilex paraguariensis]|uniref:PAR1 protein n=1 Tax=Ilex paraguariensis TaxID=185542 RepID=A0ABC8SVI2_9AQUA